MVIADNSAYCFLVAGLYNAQPCNERQVTEMLSVEPMRISQSPITWFIAVLLLVGSATAAVLFLRMDHAFSAAPAAAAVNCTAAAVGEGRPTILISAISDKVQIQEFSSMEKCSEAATYISIGTERRALAQCVAK